MFATREVLADLSGSADGDYGDKLPDKQGLFGGRLLERSTSLLLSPNSFRRGRKRFRP